MNTRTAVRRCRRLILALTGALLLTTSLATSASARTPVDPSTLNPPPPASFNAVCYRDGSHISCDLAFSDPDMVDQPSGIVCNGTELLVSQSRSVVGKRTYDAAGNLLQRHFRESLTGTYTDPARFSARRIGPRTSAEQSAPMRIAICWYFGVAPTRNPVFRSCDVVPPFEDAMQTMPPIESAVTK